MQGQPPRLRAIGVTKSYVSAGAPLRVLDDITLEIRTGESVALTGESGSGKTTLLHILGGLDRPTSGQVYFGSVELGSLSSDALASFRNRNIGFVWQQASLLPEFTALENVAMPLLIRGERLDSARAAALEWLSETGLRDRALHRTGEMSGGEQQRVALARALVTRPVLLLADEPTGNLDNQTGERIILLLEALQAKYELTSLIVTHSPLLASRCNRQIRLAGGRAMVTDNGSGRPERSGQMPDGEVPGSLPGEPGGVRPLMSGWEGLGANFAARG